MGLPGGLVTSMSGQPGLPGLTTPGPGGHPAAAAGLPPWADLGQGLGGGGGSGWAGGGGGAHGAGLAANTGKEKGGLGAEITPVVVDPNIDFDQVGSQGMPPQLCYTVVNVERAWCYASEGRITVIT
jgi:hypothetical protein